MINNTFCDKLIEKMKFTLPRLTNLFSSVLNIEIINININNGKITFTTKEEHLLEDGNRIYIHNVKIPLKISNLQYDNENKLLTFETNFYHHLLARLTKTIKLLSTDINGFSGEFELYNDVDGKTLTIKCNEEPINYDNTYLLISHNDIINGFQTIKVIDDFNFYFDIEDFDIEQDLNIFKECIEDIKITISPRVYKCFDLQDAINFYNISLERIKIGGTNIDDFIVKDENCLTAFVQPPLISKMFNTDDAVGTQTFNLEIYLFIPLKIQSLEGRMANISDNILSVANDVINRTICNKTHSFNYGICQKQTSLLLFKSSQPAIDRTNTLYIHKLSYQFGIETYADDYDDKVDYYRLNNLLYSSKHEKDIEITY